MKISLLLTISINFAICYTSNAQLIFNNGPYFNSAGTGPSGSNLSVLYDATFGMSAFGFGHSIVSSNSIADDFSFASTGTIDSIVFFAYQTGSTTTSTINDVRLQIWDGPPDAMGSNIIYGDLTTNRLTRTIWSNTYRVTESNLSNTDRPIMRNVCVLASPLALTAGTYWLHWQTGGTASSGPWAPLLTPVGVAASGNGKQLTTTGWVNAVDGSGPAQGFPFLIYGVFAPVAEIVGGANYTTLQAAINAATSGNTIKLLQNISETNIAISNSVILNNNSFTLKASGLSIPASNYLTCLSDSLIIPTGFLFTNNGILTNTGTIKNNGTILNNGTINSTTSIKNLGTYKGTGVIAGALLNNGSVKPGI
jgi:hypothetical protein